MPARVRASGRLVDARRRRSRCPSRCAAEQEDVRRLDVAVHDPRVVRGCERGATSRPTSSASAARAARALPRLEVLAVEPLHRDVRRAGLEPPAEPVGVGRLERAERHDANDAGVVELGEDLPLPGEARVLDRVDVARGADDLDATSSLPTRVEAR